MREVELHRLMTTTASLFYAAGLAGPGIAGADIQVRFTRRREHGTRPPLPLADTATPSFGASSSRARVVETQAPLPWAPCRLSQAHRADCKVARCRLF